ncbi:hypothetical protein [Methanoregula formicica]|nr:hypothetical protein [Methanoregula formicica]
MSSAETVAELRAAQEVVRMIYRNYVDQQYYRVLLDRAWEEVAFAFRQEKPEDCREKLPVGLCVS